MLSSDLLTRIKDVLNKREPAIIKDNTGRYREASVLVPVFEKEGRVFLLFIKRSNYVEHHKGQISFPGGEVDKTDPSVEYTALREAYEEIGIKKEDVKILGRLDDTITFVSRYIVHPFIGLIPYPYSFVINKKEVEKLMFVPLDFLLKKGAIKEEPVLYEGRIYKSLVFRYDSEMVWGATARMVKNLIDIIGA